MMGRLWGYVAAALAAIAGVVALYVKGRKDGSTTERAEQTEKILEKVEKANRIRRSDDRSGVHKFDRK